MTIGVVALSALVILTACSAEQLRDIEGANVKEHLDDATNDALSAANIELDGDLACRADVADDSTVTGSCSGIDTDGVDVGSVLVGSIAFDDANCDGHLTVTWDDESVLEDPHYSCFNDS